MKSSISRRSFLKAFTILSGSMAAPSLWSGLSPARAAYNTSRPELPPGFGAGKSVAVLGAGVAGLTTAYVLANAGFKVVVLEADDRYGGRSLTARPSDEHYKDWWFSKYNPERLFPKMYADTYQERGDSPAPVEQVCRFMDDAWADGGYEGDPVELFLNAGPGRIPSNHVNLIALCQEIGVPLEPYFFQTMSNVMQSDAFNGGKPIPMGQVTYSLFAEMAELAAKVNVEACKLGGNTAKQIAELQQVFGDLSRADPGDPCNLVINEASSRVGFTELPGGWRDAGALRNRIPAQSIFDSGFIGDPAANPELSPGSFLFNGYHIDWQPSLMQPVGGMDRIWQQLLLQEVPADSLLFGAPSNPGQGARVGDLVRLSTRVTGISAKPGRVVTNVQYEAITVGEANGPTEEVLTDFCVSTMAPSLLNDVLDPANMPRAFLSGLEDFSATGHWGSDPTPNLWTPAIKVGWQGKNRFWETEDEIYGGISWTDDIISQIWYPSEDFTAHTGVLTGAYNRGQGAVQFASYDQKKRIEEGIHGLGLLHPGNEKDIYVDRGMTIAWQYMPHQVGGWASDTALESPEVYEKITTFSPDLPFFCAGDTWSYWPGWQEGSVSSAYCAIAAIALAIDPGNPHYEEKACNMKG
ncbi:FAD-dependent oxidoreductase [Breoghania sp. L-A4]|uniref:flavin monoamine oxidase family protein n=1 Tax=Breoghania sp. L-A4 TaxID=2304600 RepID=UPI0027380795|nr:FAD-dependent oxidoreductase [Breoghania sp. L-A4]